MSNISHNINTEGGTFVEGDVRADGDFVSRDQINKITVNHYYFIEEISDIFLRYGITEDELRNTARCYVHNPSFVQATKLLEEQSYCIITGEPGIGKTTLAQMLILDYVRNGYEAICLFDEDILDEIKRFEPNKQRIYYFDDFLGSTRYSSGARRNSSKILLRFIEKMRRSKTTKIILTTRTYILNQARQSDEILDHANLQTCVISLNDYNLENVRKKIFQNHLELSPSPLPQKYKDALYEPTIQASITNHRNFNPRIISYMTNMAQLEYSNAQSPYEYAKQFIHNLSNPLKIWEHAFEEHLSEEARQLILVLYSLPTPCGCQYLEIAYESYAKQNNPNHSLLGFKKGLREVTTVFIRIISDEIQDNVDYQNPSVKDYIENFVGNQPKFEHALINTAAFPDQIAQCVDRYFTEGAMFGTDDISELAKRCSNRLYELQDRPECGPRIDAQLTNTMFALRGLLELNSNTIDVDIEEKLKEIFMKEIEKIEPYSFQEFDVLEDIYEWAESGHWAEEPIQAKYKLFLEYFIDDYRYSLELDDVDIEMGATLILTIERASYFGVDTTPYDYLLDHTPEFQR